MVCMTGATGGGGRNSVQPTSSTDSDQLPNGSAAACLFHVCCVDSDNQLL